MQPLLTGRYIVLVAIKVLYYSEELEKQLFIIVFQGYPESNFASTSWLLLCSPCYVSVMTPPDHLVQLHHVCLSLLCFILNIFLISSVFNHHLIKTSLN